MDFAKKLGEEFKIRIDHANNIIKLIEEGNTIPFIARYRKEMTGACDDQVLREFNDRLNYLKNLEKRKEEVRNSITEQGKMTDEIENALLNSQTLTEVEDIYRPYKQKRKTRASIAIEKGLQPLADIILGQNTKEDILKLAEEKPCVIVGRCADYILSSSGKFNEKKLLNVFICADFNDRIERGIKYYGLPANDAKKIITQIDKRRANHYNTFTENEWGNRKNYELILNSSYFGIDAAVDIICNSAVID